ncbi:MAG: nucleotidyl transferase AbiEii/AbiGii toxin family protein, partial [Candidatus Omnitrophica bacterium]|nr:nucleotidyl transferase AbiEii/AbiGii toxin family protein [Candidatus Omnitrophota bacterium]
MKDYVLELAASKSSADDKFNTLREYLQSYVLRIMQDFGAFHYCAFLGGTALRFLFGLPRFSEDLNFSLVNKQEKTFIELISHIKKELELSGYNIEISYKDVKTVQSAMIKFSDLMYESGLSGLKSQKISVKLEIDTNPPQGEKLNTKIINKYFPLSFLTYDLSSLFAGKMHAVLSRRYSKGRDFYDIFWYLSRMKDIEPNIVFLQNALKQTEWDKAMPQENNWRDYLKKVVEDVDWDVVDKDVGNF